MKITNRKTGPHLAGLALLGAIIAVAPLPAHAAPTVSPTVTPVKVAGLRKAIAAQKGKVVLVNFWATWCAPCVAELPELARLQKAGAAKGLRVLLVSADDPGTTAAVKSTLAAKGVRSSYLMQSQLLDFFDEFDPHDKSAIALPRSYVYDRKGRMVKKIRQDHTAAEYRKMVAPYLKK